MVYVAVAAEKAVSTASKTKTEMAMEMGKREFGNGLAAGDDVDAIGGGSGGG